MAEPTEASSLPTSAPDQLPRSDCALGQQGGPWGQEGAGDTVSTGQEALLGDDFPMMGAVLNPSPDSMTIPHRACKK